MHQAGLGDVRGVSPVPKSLRALLAVPRASNRHLARHVQPSRFCCDRHAVSLLKMNFIIEYM